MTHLSKYDLTIIGGGLSGCYLIIKLIDSFLHRKKVQPKKFRILILEKCDGNLGGGIPYGQSSDYNSLIITSLDKFLPEKEKKSFLNYLLENKEFFQEYFNSAGPVLDIWLDNNMDKLNKENFDDIYFPRKMFGKFLRHKFDKAKNFLEENNFAQVDILHQEVFEIQKSNDTFTITTNCNSLSSHHVALCIGSIENSKRFSNCEGYIHNPYSPSLVDTRHHVKKYLSCKENANIALIGANASMLDVIYSLACDPEITQKLDKYVIISRGGKLPDFTPTSKHVSEYNLFSSGNTIQHNNPSTAKKLFSIIENEILTAKNLGYTAWDFASPICTWTASQLKTLPPQEQNLFVTRFGIKLTDHLRRTGDDYSNLMRGLIHNGKIIILDGTFVSMNTDGSALNLAIETREGEKNINNVDMVINCSGFKHIEEFPHYIKINSIKISTDIIKVNQTKRGVHLNENFQAYKNFYVMGPLMAGYIGEDNFIWHLENAGKIISLSQRLAECVYDGLIYNSNG